MLGLLAPDRVIAVLQQEAAEPHREVVVQAVAAVAGAVEQRRHHRGAVRADAVVDVLHARLGLDRPLVAEEVANRGRPAQRQVHAVQVAGPQPGNSWRTRKPVGSQA